MFILLCVRANARVCVIHLRVYIIYILLYLYTFNVPIVHDWSRSVMALNYPRVCVTHIGGRASAFNCEHRSKKRVKAKTATSLLTH